MNKSLRPFWFLLSVLVVMITISLLRGRFGAKEIIPWRTDLAAATEESRASGKPLLIYFTASWCGPCQSLKHTTWADSQVEEAMRSYIPVKIDIDEHRDLAQQYQVNAVPTFAKGDDRAEGAMDSRAFLEWLGRN